MTALVQMELQSVNRDYITELNRDVFSLRFSRAVLLAVLHRHTLIIQTDSLLLSVSLSLLRDGGMKKTLPSDFTSPSVTEQQ